MEDRRATGQTIARRLVLHGRVQGVFYRDWTVKTAREFGVCGWVMNLPDGTVQAHCEGSHDAVERLVEAMRSGPPRAQVSEIEESDVAPKNFESFERR
ncbi:MAG: acylphosphatase [Erythrobacter sp.]|nr:acylphosphatase [Erythrobacter sp.]